MLKKKETWKRRQMKTKTSETQRDKTLNIQTIQPAWQILKEIVLEKYQNEKRRSETPKDKTRGNDQSQQTWKMLQTD